MPSTPQIILPIDNEQLYSAAPDPELARLIEGCKANERSAQETLYKRYYGKMMAMCLRYTGNRDDAMEVLNTGFLKVFKSLDSYKSNGSFDGWVYRIIYNSVIDRLRTRMKEMKTVEVDNDMAIATIDTSSIQELYVKDLMGLMQELPQSTRLVFNMFAIEGYQHSEIAELLNISEGTSKWHVNQARKILKQRIETNYSKS
jgi:RNA polymerase sigma factor (sigma-70 family)